MPAFCLLPKVAEKFKQGMISGEIDPMKLAAMTSAERRAFFAKWVGESNAKPVNALFESKMILKNQQIGYVNWAKRIVGISKETRRDLIARIERLDRVLSPKEEEAFLNDLVDKRLGTDVTFEEAQGIADYYKKVAELKEKIPDNSPVRSPERIEYGTALAKLKDYFADLKLANKDRMSLAERVSFPVKHPIQTIEGAAGIAKSIVASLDNSFFGRQGIKMLYSHPTVWSKNFAKSWLDLGKQALAKGKWYKSGDDAVMTAVKADILSRPNALNGKYGVGGYGLDVNTEEAFPSAFPEKIPLLGRLFKASEVAYNAGALRMRADYADLLIKRAEQAGLNMLDKTDAEGVAQVVSSLTGRGKVNLTPNQSKFVNSAIFSIKYLKSNYDVLTQPIGRGQTSGNAFAKKEAAKNLLKIIISIGTIMAIQELIKPGSSEFDPRGTNFGRIKAGKYHIDISGGLTSLVTLASRIVPTYHDGQWGFWSKNSNGEYTKLNAKNKDGTPKFGTRRAFDVLIDFITGKTSPIASVAVDVYKGSNFEGETPTVKNELPKVTAPLTPVSGWERFKKDPAYAWLVILDGLGLQVSDPVETKEKKKEPSKKKTPQRKF